MNRREENRNKHIRLMMIMKKSMQVLYIFLSGE